MMGRRRKHIRATQCDRCSRQGVRCREALQQQCARAEFAALAAGAVYECFDFDEDYWGKMCA